MLSRTEVILLFALLVLIIFVPVAGATTGELHEAPTNPDFIKYIEENQSGLTVVGTQSLGLAPSPISRPDVLDVQLFGPAAGEPAASYPVTFDLRTYGKVSPVKNQDPWGTCWAFATFGSLESTLMPAAPIPNFSEINLVNLAGFDFPIPDGGGNLWMSTAYLVRWNGPVDDATDPYPKHSWTSSRTHPPVKHVQNVVFLPARSNRTDTGNIKGALTRWGAVSTALYWYEIFYNETHTSYYQPASDTGVDHGHWVTIIGWDDTYEATNFNTTADGPGAWLVKNSWGAEWGSEGCFYVSYYDKSIGSAIQPSGTYHNLSLIHISEPTRPY